jgi:formylglycine-generating enzyme required for sulfatase activity
MNRSFALFAPFVLVGLLLGCSDQSGQTATNQATTDTAASQTAANQAAAEQAAADAADASQAAANHTIETVTNSIGMEFVSIPAGSFMMGTDENLAYAAKDETPRHKVTISQPFYLGKYEVTQKEWEAVMDDNPCKLKGENNPVETVSYREVLRFIERLNQKEGTDKYRLPTEAEWEYAARAGTTSAFFFGDDVGSLKRYAWYDRNSEGKTHPVGQKEPNPWGLYDMHGNVGEWVQDWYDKNYYAQSLASDPRGPSGGSGRVVRGGGWDISDEYLRSAFRNYYSPELRNRSLGFRLAFTPDHP